MSGGSDSPAPTTVDAFRERGYFGIGIYAGKTPDNLGGLWRSAHAFGADFLFTIGARYSGRHPTDTTSAARHVPLFEFKDWIEFREAAPFAADIIGVEIDDRARPLASFCHPERAVYVLGAEDRGLSEEAARGCDSLVAIPSALCLNVATAGSIVLYDRKAKRTQSSTATRVERLIELADEGVLQDKRRAMR